MEGKAEDKIQANNCSIYKRSDGGEKEQRADGEVIGGEARNR